MPLLVAAGLTSFALLNSAASAAVTCTTTITGTHPTQLTVTSGVTCLDDATQNGSVTVDAGAGLSVTSSTVNGIVTATDASSITYCGSTQSGTMKITGTTGGVTLGDGGSCAADTIPSLITITGTAGPVDINGLKENGTLTLESNTGGVTLNGISLSGLAYVENNTGTAAVTVSGNHINGSLYCTGNTPAPGDNGAVNIVSGTATGQCTAISSRTGTHTAPVLANIETTALAYTAGSAAVPVTATLTVSSADATTLAGATVKISSGLTSGDTLGFTSQNGINGSYNSSTGVLTLSGTTTLANYETALRLVTFSSSASAPTGTRAISFQVNDGTSSNNLSNTESRAIDVTAKSAPAAPVIANVETTALSYQSGTAAVPVTATLTVADSSGAEISGATVSITSGFDSGADTLGFATVDGITGTYDASTGVLTLSGSATVADYQAALRSVTFATTDTSATPAARAVSFTVTDTNSETSNTESRTIDVTAAATAPTAVNQAYTAVGNTTLAVGTTPTGPAVTESASDGLLSGDTGNSSCGTLSVTGNTTPAHGTVTVSANGDFTYLPAVGYTGNDTFNYTITCSSSGKTATAGVTITVGTVVWYVNNSASTAGNGESSSPFNSLAAANGAITTSSIVFLYTGSGNYTGGLTLKSGDSLFGQPHGLTVTVGGTAYALVAAGGSNPVITNSGGNGITLASGVDIENVNVSDASGDGISGTGITGTVTINDCTVADSTEDNAVITDTTGSLTLNVTGSAFNGDNSSDNYYGFIVNANGSTDATVSITGSTITNSVANVQDPDFEFTTNSSATGTNSITFSTNTLNGGGGVLIWPNGTSDTTITVDTNSIQNSYADGIDALDQGAMLTGTINGNNVGTPTVAGAYTGDDIEADAEDTATETVAITDNNVYQYGGEAGIQSIDAEGSATANLTITGNTIADPMSNAGWGLNIQAGAESTDSGKVCADISGNALAGSAPPASEGGYADLEVDQEDNATFDLAGYTGSSTDDAAVVSYLQGQNNKNGTPTVLAENYFTLGPATFTGVASCPAP